MTKERHHQLSKEQQFLLDELKNHSHRTHERAIWICNPFATHESFLDFSYTTIPLPTVTERHKAALNAPKKTKHALKTLSSLLQKGIDLDTPEKLFPAGSPATQLNGLNDPARNSLAVIRHICETLNDYKEENRLPLFATAVGLAQVVITKSDLHHGFTAKSGHEPHRQAKRRHDKSQKNRIRSLVFAFGLQNLREYGHNKLADRLLTEKALAMYERNLRAQRQKELPKGARRRKLS